MERENHNKDGAIPPHQAGKSPHPTPMMLINEISKLFGQRMRRASEQAGIPDGYRWILFHLGHRKSATQLELSKLTHTTPPTVSITLRNMEAEEAAEATASKSSLGYFLMYCLGVFSGVVGMIVYSAIRANRFDFFGWFRKKEK